MRLKVRKHCLSITQITQHKTFGHDQFEALFHVGTPLASMHVAAR